MITDGAAPDSAPISRPVRCRRRSCRRMPGRPPRATATGRWSAARSRQASSLRSSNWRRRIGSRRDFIGWAKRSVPTIARPRAQNDGEHASLCPPYFLPHHIFRRDQSTAGDQDRGDGNRGGCLRKARKNQKRRRQQRRRIGRGAQHADVAALHADVPDKERGPHRPDAERDDRQPLPDRLRPHRGLDHARCTSAASSAVARQKPATASVGTALSLRDITE